MDHDVKRLLTNKCGSREGYSLVVHKKRSRIMTDITTCIPSAHGMFL